jgi:hypothetical protein
VSTFQKIAADAAVTVLRTGAPLGRCAELRCTQFTCNCENDAQFLSQFARNAEPVTSPVDVGEKETSVDLLVEGGAVQQNLHVPQNANASDVGVNRTHGPVAQAAAGSLSSDGNVQLDSSKI